ncbi:10433_t:CDS:2 [Cetraspora pellucida]|uniref:10433_t:CDS:1 n=1 Tax=Cetraspora pellucida TaxID=1433469 RepID=A0A9N9D945_9GLOM|nr:10433_t:CDS:2 [Cetraspora pellucida]
MASDLEGVFYQIDQTMFIQNLKASMRQGSNKVVIDNIKKTLQSMTKEPDMHENAETCEYSTKINYKLSCKHIIPKNVPIPLLAINNRWLLDRLNIIELLHPSKSAAINTKFYEIFVKAEKKFQQLLDNINKKEFITKLNQVMNMPLPEPIKPLPIEGPKGSLLDTNKTIQQQNMSLKPKFSDLYILGNKLFKANIPKFMQEYVLDYFNVCKNGNCGFHAIIVSVEKSEECWPDI